MNSGMADEMDPCECMWSQELAMRRLISLLRQGQTYCTDSECLDEIQGLPAGSTSAGGSFMVLFLTLALAVAMYAFRPRARLQLEEARKPLRNPQDHDDGAPPTPPRI